MRETEIERESERGETGNSKVLRFGWGKKVVICSG